MHRPVPRGQRQQPTKELPGQRWYDGQWQATRARFLSQHPFCVAKEDDGTACRALATDVDHVVPHRGDRRLFRDWGNLQSMCARHHGKKTRAEGGRTYG